MLVQKPPGKTSRTPWMIDMETRLVAAETILDKLQRKLKNAENTESKTKEK